VWVCARARNRLGYKFSRGFCVLFCRRTPLATTCTRRQHLYNIYTHTHTRICAVYMSVYTYIYRKGCGRKWFFSPTKLKTFSPSFADSCTFAAVAVAERAFTERLLITLFMPGDRTVERLTLVRPLQRGSALYEIVPRPKAVLYAVNLPKFNSPPLNNRRGFINGNTLLAINSAACRVHHVGDGGGKTHTVNLFARRNPFHSTYIYECKDGWSVVDLWQAYRLSFPLDRFLYTCID